MTDPRSDEQLLAAFARGDREALGALAGRYERSMLGLALGLLGGDRTLAMDAVQEVWVGTIRRAGGRSDTVCPQGAGKESAMVSPRIVAFTAVAAVAGFGAPALGQGPPDYGFTWHTVGAPGNPDARPRDFVFLRIDGIGPVGRVNRPYRLTSTEITVADYFEYVQAYSPYYPEGIYDRAFWGRYIYNERNDPNDPGWYIGENAHNFPADMGWLHAARFSNWLHNGKNPEQWAFESGAYDMSTFSQLPNGDWVGQERRSPGAQFWIPSLDEWIKGMYYDSNRWGPGEGGYWMYPITSATPPVGGLPGTPGAQTSAGEYDGYHGQMFDVGSYPDTMSPWGLLDGSGGRSEWTETDPVNNGRRYGKGTRAGSPSTEHFDRLDWVGSSGTSAPGPALRLASRIPSPSPLMVIVLAMGFATHRRRTSSCCFA